MSLNIKQWFVICCFTTLSGCGFAVSDEERLARADEKINAGAYRAATIELKNILANDIDNVDARLRLARVSLGLGDVLTAEKELMRAAELGGDESSIRPLHLKILAAQYKFTEMLAALGMESGGLSAAQQLEHRGIALLGLGNVDAAATAYREWQALEPASVDAAVGLAKSNAAMGNVDGSIAELELIVSSHPEHVGAMHALAVQYFMSGDYEAAEAAFAKTIKSLRPQTDMNLYAGVLVGLTESRLILGQNEDARTSLEQLTSIIPQAPVTLLLAARLARIEQDYALAARHLQALLNVDPENSQAQFLLANVQLIRGNFSQAEGLLNRVVAQAPDNLEARKLLAQVQLRQSQPQGAIEALAPFLDEAQDDAELYHLMAEVSLQQGDAQSAIDNLRTASELAPNNVEAKLNLAGAYLNAGKAGSAIEILVAVPERSSANFRREALMMLALEAENRGDDARALSQELLKEHSRESGAVMVVATRFIRSGELDNAQDVLQGFLKLEPGNIDAMNSLASVRMAAGDMTMASELFRSVQKINETNLFASLGLARIEEIAGNSSAAIRMLEYAASNHSSELAPRVWLAKKYLETGRVDDAEKMATELIATGFRNAEVSNVVGTVFLEAGRLDEAVSQLEIAARLKPESATVQFKLARAYLALGRTVDARQSLDNALEISPGWLPAKATLALVELRQGQSNEAARHVAELRADNPTNTAVMVLEGEVLSYQADFVGAAQAYQRAVSAGAGRPAMLREFQARVGGKLDDPESPILRWLEQNAEDVASRKVLAQFYQQNNSGDNAIREYELALRDDPNDVIVLNNLAWQYQQLGRLDSAVELAEKAYQIDSKSGSVVDTLGWIYRDVGQLEKSIELLNNAKRLSPDNGEIRFHLAMVLFESGETGEARKLLEELIKSDSVFSSREQAVQLLDKL